MEEMMGLLTLLLLGLATPALAALNGFHYVDQLKNWTEAQSYCRDKFTDLATIHTQDDWTTVTEIIANSGYPDAWLGLYDDVKSWRWSLDNTSLYDADLGSWFVFDEDYKDSNAHCAEIRNGILYNFNCEFTLPTICYDETTDSYIIDSVNRNRSSAQSYCREHHTDLASFKDQQELNAIISATDPHEYYWIGLSREGWKWSDQSDSSFRQWRNGEPVGYLQDCGAAAVDGWYVAHCGDTLPFICSVPPRHSNVLKVTVKTDGSVNLNDPLVQEAILKQMEKDLRGQGLTQELSLSWRKQAHGQVFNKTEL